MPSSRSPRRRRSRSRSHEDDNNEDDRQQRRSRRGNSSTPPKSASPPPRRPSSPSPSSSSHRRHRRRSSPSSPPPSSSRGGPWRSRSPRGAGRGDHRDGEAPKPCRVVGVFGLNYKTTSRYLERKFSRFGRLEGVDLVRDPEGESRGFGFITFAHLDDAMDAKEKMADTFMDGKRIRVDYSTSKGPHPKTPGHYMGRRSRSPPPRPYSRRSPSPRRRRESRSPMRRY